MIANLPRFLKRNRTAPIHFSPRDAHGTTSGTPTGARAAGDGGPYHAPRHVRQRTPRPHTHAMSAHARHARTWSGATSPARRAHGTPTGTRAAGDVGPYHAPRHVRTRTSRAAHARHARTWQGATSPARRAHGTTSGTPTGARAAGDVGPYHAPRHVRQRTPYPHTHTTSAHARHARTWSGATSSARRAHGTPTGLHRKRPRARGPPGTSAPTTHRATSAHARRVPHTHATSAHARHARTW